MVAANGCEIADKKRGLTKIGGQDRGWAGQDELCGRREEIETWRAFGS
jgi:hypothetical protein